MKHVFVDSGAFFLELAARHDERGGHRNLFIAPLRRASEYVTGTILAHGRRILPRGAHAILVGPATYEIRSSGIFPRPSGRQFTIRVAAISSTRKSREYNSNTWGADEFEIRTCTPRLFSSRATSRSRS